MSCRVHARVWPSPSKQVPATVCAATVCVLLCMLACTCMPFPGTQRGCMCVVCCVRAFLHQLTCCVHGCLGVSGGSHTSCQSEAPVCCWALTLLRRPACLVTTPTMVRMPGQAGIEVSGAQHGMNENMSVTRSWYMQQRTAQNSIHKLFPNISPCVCTCTHCVLCTDGGSTLSTSTYATLSV